MDLAHSLCHLFVWIFFQNLVKCDDTAISVTKSLEHNQHDAKIAQDVSSFIDLISYSNVFVDKSLLIKEVVENRGQTILITYPRKWGKSVNLDMIKTFLEMEYDTAYNKTVVDEEGLSYKIFVKNQIPPYEADEGWRTLLHPLLITQHQHLLDKHRGKYPIIYVNMAHPKLNEYDSIVTGIRQALIETYSVHKYLVRGFQRRIEENCNNRRLVDILEEEMEFYHDFMHHENMGEIEMENSLQFLVKMVYEYHNKRVFVLIDHYDVMIDEVLLKVGNSSMKERNDKEFVFFQHLYAKIFTNMDYIEKVIMTGILGVEEYVSSAPQLAEFNTLNKKTRQFFGFTRSEVERLFHHFVIPPHFADKVYNQQSGYKVAADMDLFYNPQSIVFFVNNQSSLGLLPNYRTEIGDVQFHSGYEIETEKLRRIFGGFSDITIQFEHLRFNKHELESIQTMIYDTSKQSNRVNSENIKLVLLYLYATGCVTFSDKVTVKATDKTAKVLIRLS